MATKTDILKAAKQRLITYKSDAICEAVQSARCGTQKQKNAIKTEVMRAIAPHSWFASWLRDIRADFSRLSDMEQRVVARETRIAWIDDMIKNLQGE